MPPVTQDFDLNQSVWLDGAVAIAPQAPLRGDVRADVVIVGGGFTGVSTAWHLSERFPDRRVVLLEARTLANGASGRSGGQMLHWINGVGYEDPELVRRVYAATDLGIRFIVDTIQKHDLKVRYAYDGTFELCTDLRRVEEGQAHALLLQSYGIDVVWKDAAETRALLAMEGVQGGLFDPRSGMVNGVDFIRALAPLLLARGVAIYENTLVTRIDEGATVRVQTAEGSVSAPTLVLATSAYSAKLGYFGDRIFPLQSHMVATGPLDPASAAAVGWRPGLAFCDDLDRIAYGGMSPTAGCSLAAARTPPTPTASGGPRRWIRLSTSAPSGRWSGAFMATSRRSPVARPSIAGAARWPSP